MTTQSSIITAKYNPQTREIALDVPYEYKDRVKLVGALWNKDEKYWYFIEPTLPICKALLDLNIVFSPALAKIYNELMFVENNAGAYKRACLQTCLKMTHIYYMGIKIRLGCLVRLEVVMQTYLIVERAKQ